MNNYDSQSDYQNYLRSLQSPQTSTRPSQPAVAIAGSPSKARKQASSWADDFRYYVPQEVRDIAGGFVRNMISGERFLNTVSGGSIDISGLPGFIRTPLDIATAPATILTAGFGGPVAAAARSVPLIGGALGAVASPVLGSGGFLGRLAAETAVGSAATGAAELASRVLPEDVPTAVKVGVPLATGLLGGGLAAGGIGAAKGVARGDTTVLRAAEDVLNPLARPRESMDAGDYIQGNFFTAPTVETVSKELSDVIPVSGPKGIIDRSVARTMERQEQTAVARLINHARTLTESLGPISRTGTTEATLTNVIDDLTGKPAYLIDVLEQTKRFKLTPEQTETIERLKSLQRTVRAEAELFGVKIEDVTPPEGIDFFPRRALAHKDGNKITVLDDGKGKVISASGTGGQNIRVLRDREREYATAAAGRENGYIYQDPIIAFESYVREQLSNAKNTHLSNLLKSFGVKVDAENAAPPDYATAIVGTRAPQLSSYQFPLETTKAITEYFGRGVIPNNQIGKAVSTVGAINKIATPLRAVLDASGSLNQNAVAFANNPVRFIKHFAQSFYQASSDQAYVDFLKDKRTVDASKYVSILGEGFAPSDFQFGEVVRRWPVVKQLQRQFEAIGNLNRREMFFSAVDSIQKNGRVLNEAEKLAIGRAVDRITGIATGRAGDIESAALFAPNFLRSMIENITAAATDGNLEGELARQYLSRYVGAGMALVTMAALAQGRELSEVLNPLDPYGLKQGEIRLNPNFATVRAGGQDVAVFGAYDSLARLAMVAGDSAFQAASSQDATKLMDFLTFAARTKGSPALASATNLVLGSTFSGEEPLSPMGLVQGFAPFSMADLVTSIHDGESPEDAAAGFFTNFLGAKSRAVTPSERRDEASRVRFGVPYSELTGQQRQTLDAEMPNLKEAAFQSLQRRADAGDVNAQARVARVQLDEQRVTTETEAYTAFQEGRLSRKQFTDALDQIQYEFAVRKDQSDKTLGIEYRDGTGAGNALSEYYETFRKAEIAPGQIDWDMQAALETQLYADIAEGKYGDPIKAKRAVDERSVAVHAPEVEWYWANKRLIQEKGYYDTLDRAYAKKRDAASRVAGRPLQDMSSFMAELNSALARNDIQKARALDVIRRQIESEASKAKETMVRKDNDLRVALEQNGKITPKALRVNR